MVGTRQARWTRWLGIGACAILLAACSSGPVRRVSEPSARIQQLTVGADGSWATQLRIENFSSIPMRFDALQLELEIADTPAGTLRAAPGVTVGPESADVVILTLVPAAGAKFAVAGALAEGRSVEYSLHGTMTATPDEGRQREFEMERDSALSPAPGLPGVLR
jgi:hypothetical protein